MLTSSASSRTKFMYSSKPYKTNNENREDQDMKICRTMVLEIFTGERRDKDTDKDRHHIQKAYYN